MPALISEWMEKGTLHDFMKTFPRCGIVASNMVRSPIRSSSPVPFTLYNKLRDIALGLVYLHSKEVIHADLKSVRTKKKFSDFASASNTLSA